MWSTGSTAGGGGWASRRGGEGGAAGGEDEDADQGHLQRRNISFRFSSTSAKTSNVVLIYWRKHVLPFIVGVVDPIHSYTVAELETKLRGAIFP